MKQETERAKREAKLRKREEEEKWMRDNMSQADKDDETVRDMKLTEECPKVIWECLVEALKTRTPEERRVAVAWMYTAIESHIGCCCNHKHWDYAIEDPVVHAEAISAVVAGDMKALSRMRTLCHESNLTTE